MFNANQDPQPVDIFLLENVGIEGKHFAKGEILKNVDGALAMEMAAQGKCRVATEEDVKAAAAAKKAAEKTSAA